MSKITKPGKGTKIREGVRLTAEAGMSFLPGGSVFTSFARWLLPSKLDKQKEEWQSSVTETTNQNSENIKELSSRTNTLMLEQVDLVGRMDDTKGHVEELARKVEIGIIQTDPLDGELEICRDLVTAEKYQTALELLSNRFNDPRRSNQISPKLKARVLSLQGMCLKNLGKNDEAAQHFLAALVSDPDSSKVRANAVVAYLIRDDTDAALDLLDRLIKDEPEMPMHWANLIYTRSQRGEKVDTETIPAVVRQSEDVCMALIQHERGNDDPNWVQHALAFAKLYPKSRQARRHGAEAALDLAIKSIVSDAVPATEATRLMLEAVAAAEELGKQWADHLETETSKSSPDVTLLQNTLSGYRLTGNRVAATALVGAHEKLLLSEDRAKQALGAYALDTNDEPLLDRVLAKDFTGSSILQLERALRDARWLDALAMCEKYPEEIAQAGRLDPTFAADVLRAVLADGPEQTAALEGIIAQKPQQAPENDLFLCKIASKAGVQGVADTALMRAATAKLGIDGELRQALASEALKRDLPDVVIRLLTGFVDPAYDSRARRWLAIAYARTSIPYESGIKFFANIRAARNADAELNRAGGHFHLNRRRPAEATPWFRRSLDLDPNNVRTQLAYWQALSREGALTRTKAFIASVDLSLIEGPAEDRMAMAQLLWRSGRQEALDYAYALAAKNRNNFQVCLGYSGLLLADAFDGNAPQIPAVNAVSIDTMVRLGRVAQDDWVIVIDDNQAHLADHVQSDNSIVQQAFGKVVGDQFETTSGPNKFTWTVKEIKSKYLHLFHEITRTLQDQFPDNGSFYSVTMVDDDVTPLLESVRARRKHIEFLEETYCDQLIPLGAIANAGGGGMIDFAVHLAQSGQKIFSATGHSHDTEREFAVAQAAKDRTVVLDTYTAWLLERLSALQAIKDVFPKLTIPASALDEFGEMIEKMSRHSNGFKSMAAQDDGYVIHELTADEVKGHASSIQETRKIIAHTCDVVGIEVPTNMDSKLLDLSNFLGTQFDCLAVMLRENGVLLSADLRIRQIATEVYEGQAFGLDALLKVAAIEGALSINTYADILLNLSEHRHSYISINGQMLYKMLLVDETSKLRRFEHAAAYLGTPNADINSHITVSAEFIGRAFSHYNGGLKAQHATSIVLRRLLNLKGIEFADMLDNLLNIINDPRVTNYVKKWLDGHFMWRTYEIQVNAKREIAKN